MVVWSWPAVNASPAIRAGEDVAVAGLGSQELKAFSDAVDDVLSEHWPHARSAGDTPLGELWSVGAAQGWSDLQSSGSLDAVVLASHRLGRVACPLPLMDCYVVARLFAQDPRVGEQIAAGTIRPVVATVGEVDTPILRHVEAADAATHVAVVASGGRVVLRSITSVTPTPGLARPAWSDVVVHPDGVAVADVGTDAVEQARSLLRLGLVARAVGAASRSVEYAIEHAQQRTAFGHPIGHFQAVSHRAVNGATDVTASMQLIDEAVRAWLNDRPDRQLASELAVEFGGTAAIDAQFGAQHTLAAMGYFEEHDLPWLFRRVNADIAQLEAIPPAGGEVADMLIEGPRRLPQLELGDHADAFRSEVRAFLAPFETDAPVLHFDDDGDPALTAAAVDAGYLTMSWPAAAGGRDAPVEEQVVIGEEIAYRRVPLRGKITADMLGTAIARHGTPAQQERILPLLASGRFPYYLGYSEPEIGSDLANLRTRAVRDGDNWIVNGRKMWGTGAHTAEWVWLAARTDPTASPPHAGITMFLTRTDRPGFELHQHIALSGEISCSTFFDDYPVPDADRIGEVDGGWKVITEALAQERVVMANTAATVLRMLDDMLDEIGMDVLGTVGPRGSAKRRLLSVLAARLQAARALVAASVRATARPGGGARLEAPMAKIIATQLLEDFGEAALRIFGPAAALGEGIPGVPGRGGFEYNLRLSIMQVVGGGTIDIQRNLVARALGLPR